MKTSLLTIALAAATMPLTFAAQAPASNPPAAPAQTQTKATKTKKQHVKHSKKAPKAKTAASGNGFRAK